MKFAVSGGVTDITEEPIIITETVNTENIVP
jgi:hypothetical protein